MTLDLLGPKGPSLRERLAGSARLRFVLIGGLAIFLLTVQSVVALQPTLRADVATLFVVYLAMELGFSQGLVMTLVVGYVADVFSGEPRGLYMASLVMLFLILRLIVFRIVGSRWFTVTAIALLSTLLALLIRLGIERLLGPGRTSFATVAPALWTTFGMAALLGYPLYRLLHRMDERFRRREEAM